MHPRHLIGDGDLVVEMWLAWRAGGALPDPGGYQQQAALLMDAFRVCDQAAAALKAARRRGG